MRLNYPLTTYKTHLNPPLLKHKHNEKQRVTLRISLFLCEKSA